MKTKRIAVRLTPEMYDELQKIAKKEHRSMSNLIETYLQAMIKSYNRKRPVNQIDILKLIAEGEKNVERKDKIEFKKPINTKK